ncbi:MAG: DNA primase [candidate division Zixibacteria bacterium]|nr:DNA primase [candidate division Zixibacteria bacterium]
MARIPENKIDEIRTAGDIVEIISGYVSLKKRGRNFMGICPFHDEKTPSFSVSPDKQIYHCFGCGKGGNVFSFLMEHEKLNFVEAVRLVADRYGIILPKFEKEEDSKTERLIYANTIAAEFFQKNLKNPRYKDKIEKYLTTTRGISTETAKKFQIGLATDDWQGVLDFARTKDVKDIELAEAGLVSKSQKTGKYYDRFRMRLMIPIYNITGKVVAFGGRALKKGELAKYVNSPETPLYNKSFILYGLNFAKTAIRDTGSVILVEGYFDLISLHQAGIENVVAVSGTAFTPQQAKLLARFAQKVYLFFDADSAGRAAALRSIEVFYNAGIEPLIVSPPPGQDPDSYIREFGPEGVHELLENALGYLSFRFEKIDFAQLSLNEKEEIAREIKSLASKIEDSLKQEIFISSAADRLQIPVVTLQPGSSKKVISDSMPGRVRNMNILESELLSLFVNRPPLIEMVMSDISAEDFSGPGHGELYNKMLEVYKATGEINPDKMIEELDDKPLASGLTFISTLDWGDIDLTGVVKEYKQMLLKKKRDRLLQDLKDKLSQAEKNDNTDEAKKLTLEIKYLLEKRV